ncbi:hypothetical protein AX23_14420 [Brucella melitensis 548]|nr:hypothetical protein AX23_14420 [Brucella melitensis 548]
MWADGVIHVLGVGLALAGAIAMLFYFLPNMPAVTSISSGVYLASSLPRSEFPPFTISGRSPRPNGSCAVSTIRRFIC